MNIKQIDKKIAELQKKKEELIKLEETQDFQELTYKKDTYRIYRWENKEFGKFLIPKDFEFCPYFDFVELVNNKVFTMEIYKEYVCKNAFNNPDWVLVRVYLGWYGGIVAGNDYLQGSDPSGRVVLKKVRK